MDDNIQEDQVVEESKEESQEEELSYEEAFEAQWGTGEPKDEAEEPSEEEPPSEAAEPEEEVVKASSEEEEQEAPTEDTTSESTEPPPEDDPYAWIEKLPEDVREKAVQLKNVAGSHYGRATAFQRRVDELNRELSRMKSRDAAPADTKKPEDKSLASQSAAQETPKEWAKLQEDFPEFAEAVEAIRASDREAFNKQLEEKLAPLEQTRLQQERQQFYDKVTDAAEEIFDTKKTGVSWTDVVEGEDFKAWLQMQPGSVQQAARLPDPNEAIHVLKMYESDYQAEVARMAQIETSASSNTEQSTEAEKVKQRRAKTKQQSVTPASKPVAADPSETDGDYEAAFNARWG